MARDGNAGVESEPAQPKSKSKVKLNFGLSPDFSVQRIAERKAKSKVKVTQCTRMIRVEFMMNATKVDWSADGGRVL